jgi:TrpR-related protein YerC/YecD
VSDIKSKLQSEDMDFLFDAILSLKSKEDCYRFFEDICTINEIKALEQRIQVAKMLKQKKTYLDIANATGASTATISRVNRALNYGSDGYNLVFERIEWEDK